ncbi:MAG: DUF362 domain-containing protein [Desulfovibrionaceae bacterium]|nr:DUF362 domain-containing protein [Desulfovibrionaceae bacterium]
MADGASVALAACSGYDAAVAPVWAALDASGWKPGRGAAILVKPNLLRAVPLACTHPAVVAAACAWLLDQGARVRVADSPGFGTAAGVAQAVGLVDALRPLGLTVSALGNPVPVPLSRGGHWGVSRLALESDGVLSLPKVKAHAMMRLSLSVKNLFGCVCGVRKAWAHTRQGGSPDDFTHALLDVYKALPPVTALADGVIAMHVTGPSGGQPFPLGLVAASGSAPALDAALGALLGARPSDVPLWAEMLRQGLPGTDSLVYPLEPPGNFHATGFILPAALDDISFRPHRLALSLIRRVIRACRGA